MKGVEAVCIREQTSIIGRISKDYHGPKELKCNNEKTGQPTGSRRKGRKDGLRVA